MSEGFLGGRLSGGNTHGGRRSSYASTDFSGNDTLNMQDKMNDISYSIREKYDDASKVIAQYAKQQNGSGNTSTSKMEKQILQFVKGFDSNAQVEILAKALARTISNL